MNAKKLSVARAGLVVGSVLAIALTGCRTRVVENTRTVYVPAPTPVESAPPAPAPQPPPPQVVYVQPPPQPAPPPQVVYVQPPEQQVVVIIQSENDFYEPLAAHGRWVVVSPYGRVWVPARVERDWRPYSNGYWQRTDAGWYWESDEPWAWATYHYGRWDFHASYGWIWVPQTQWAPAWVSWREGGGYVGWAPLRPSARIGVSVRSSDYEPAEPSRAFVFVEHRRMMEPVRPKTVIVNNTTIINKTVNITQVKVVNKVVINEGPRPEVIERESGRKVQAVPAREVRHREETAVAARERNIPTARNRKVETPASTERQPMEKPAVVPSVTPRVEPPVEAVTQPTKPFVAPVRPTTPQPQPGRPVRDERKRDAETVTNVSTTVPTVEPLAKPESRPEKAVLPRQEVQPVQKPTVVTKPAPQPVIASPTGQEKKREPAIEKRNAVTPPVVEAKPRPGTRPATRIETNAPAKVKSVPSAAVKKQTGSPSAKPSNKPLLSPRQQPHAPEPAEASKQKKNNGNPNKRGEDQSPATNGVATPSPQ